MRVRATCLCAMRHLANPAKHYRSVPQVDRPKVTDFVGHPLSVTYAYVRKVWWSRNMDLL